MPDGTVEYAERGQGPTILLVPGSFGTGAGWRPIMELLGDRYRFVTTSLFGYGATAERRSAGNTSIDLQVEALAGVIRRAGGRVHIVGHSFGGVATLALALQSMDQIASLTLIEANPADVLRQAGDTHLFQQFLGMSDAYVSAFKAGDKEAARRVIDFYGGAGAFDAFPQKVRDYVVQTTPANVLDWSTMYGFDAPLSAYATITAPTLIIRGGKGHAAMVRLAELLHKAIPGASLVSIADGTHFLPSTHPPRLAELISAHVASCK